MADFFTVKELEMMSKIPEGFEEVPVEYRYKYFLLAAEQIGMVQTTLAHLTLQGLRDANPNVAPGAAAGCVTGLERAMRFVMGYRAIPGYTKPVAVSKSVDAAQAVEAQGELLNTGEQAVANMKGIF